MGTAGSGLLVAPGVRANGRGRGFGKGSSSIIPEMGNKDGFQFSVVEDARVSAMGFALPRVTLEVMSRVASGGVPLVQRRSDGRSSAEVIAGFPDLNALLDPIVSGRITRVGSVDVFMEEGLIRVNGQPLRLQRWIPNFNVNNDRIDYHRQWGSTRARCFGYFFGGPYWTEGWGYVIMLAGTKGGELCRRWVVIFNGKQYTSRKTRGRGNQRPVTYPPRITRSEANRRKGA
ncbi:hypothetical protein NE237_031631 [Protea cynaroides]|uniref:Uncharacterized protein n=1 Tax=Protea cynaroides TaxID=273540 RepID=A0A9Q0L1V0_9MAGN|nr:hypothetical protein NE237_031631 [Protea cynaroides]